MRAELRSEPWDARDVTSPSSKGHFGNSPALLADRSLPFALLPLRCREKPGKLCGRLQHQQPESEGWQLPPGKKRPKLPKLPLPAPCWDAPGDSRDIVVCTQHPWPSMDSSIPFWQRCGRALLIRLPVQPFLLLFSMRTGYVCLALISFFFFKFSLCSWMNWLLLSSASLCRVSWSPNNQMRWERVYGFVINRLHTERCGVPKECVKRKWSKTWSWFWFNLNNFLQSRSGEIIWGRSDQTLILFCFSRQMSSP